MRVRRHIGTPVALAVATALVGTLPTIAPASAATAMTPSVQVEQEPLSIWDDPTFQKQFLGSFGILSDVEPTVTTLQREQLQEILPLMQDDPEAARAKLEELEERDPGPLVDFLIGSIHLLGDRVDEAIERYRRAVDAFPRFLRAHKNLGVALMRTGRYDEAIEPLSKVVELGGADGTTYGLLGYAYSSNRKFIAAESAFRTAMLLDPETRDWRSGLTLTVLKQRKYAEAVALADDLIATEPENRDYWLLQANAYIGLGDVMAAAENYEILDRMGLSTADSLKTLGDIYVNERLWALAARSYARAMDLEAAKDKGASRAVRWAEILAQRGAAAQARELVDKVQSLYGDTLDEEQRKKLLKIEARMAVAEGDGDDRIAILEEIVQIDPLDGEALILLGQHYAETDEVEQAVFYYERALSLEDHEADASIRLAQLYVNQGKYADAVPLLKRAQELEPRDDVGRFLEQVQRVARASR